MISLVDIRARYRLTLSDDAIETSATSLQRVIEEGIGEEGIGERHQRLEQVERGQLSPAAAADRLVRLLEKDDGEAIASETLREALTREFAAAVEPEGRATATFLPCEPSSFCSNSLPACYLKTHGNGPTGA